MKVHCFTTLTFADLNRARVLFSTVRKFAPDWHTVALIVDTPPESYAFRPEREPFDEFVYADELEINNFQSWMFAHDITEACAAVKGRYIQRASESDADVVVFLGPGSCLFASLDPAIECLDPAHSIVAPQPGAFNLDFCAIRNDSEGKRFAHVHHLDDAGYIAGPWNLNERTIVIGGDGAVTVDGSPLRLWQFPRIDYDAGLLGRARAEQNFASHELWNWYVRNVRENTDYAIPSDYWAYGMYDDGTPIQHRHRELYRNSDELVEVFPDPFATGEGSFLLWLLAEGQFDEGPDPT